MNQRPRGYLGRNHETIGSDVIAVMKCLTLPRQVLGEEMTTRLQQVKPDGWYPIEWLLELMETLEARVGRSALFKMGATLFRLSHEARVKEVAHSARDVIYAVDGMYHHANRGEKIGGWRVVAFQPGHAELEKNTPHHCVMEEGILSEALRAMGAPSSVKQSKCLRNGDDICHFVLTSAVTDERWNGKG